MPLQQAGAHGRDLPGQQLAHAEPVQRPGERDVASGDAGSPRPAVGLDDVAVDGDRALAEPAHVDHAAQAATDEALDLVGPSADRAACRLALAALRAGTRQHRVLGGHPAAALAAQPARNAVLDRGGAQHAGVADPNQDRSLGELQVVRHDLHGPKLVRDPAVGATAGPGRGRWWWSLAADSTGSRRGSGQCRVDRLDDAAGDRRRCRRARTPGRGRAAAARSCTTEGSCVGRHQEERARAGGPQPDRRPGHRGTSRRWRRTRSRCCHTPSG